MELSQFINQQKQWIRLMDVCLSAADTQLEAVGDLEQEQNYRKLNSGESYIYNCYSDAEVDRLLQTARLNLKGELAKYADAQHQLIEHTAQYEATPLKHPQLVDKEDPRLAAHFS